MTDGIWAREGMPSAGPERDLMGIGPTKITILEQTFSFNSDGTFRMTHRWKFVRDDKFGEERTDVSMTGFWKIDGRKLTLEPVKGIPVITMVSEDGDTFDVSGAKYRRRGQ